MLLLVLCHFSPDRDDVFPVRRSSRSSKSHSLVPQDPNLTTKKVFGPQSVLGPSSFFSHTTFPPFWVLLVPFLPCFSPYLVCVSRTHLHVSVCVRCPVVCCCCCLLVTCVAFTCLGGSGGPSFFFSFLPPALRCGGVLLVGFRGACLSVHSRACVPFSHR